MSKHSTPITTPSTAIRHAASLVQALGHLTEATKLVDSVLGTAHVTTATVQQTYKAVYAQWQEFNILVQQEHAAAKAQQATTDKLKAKAKPQVSPQSVPSTPAPATQSGYVPGAAIAKRDALVARAKLLTSQVPYNCNLAEFEAAIVAAETASGRQHVGYDAKTGVAIGNFTQTPAPAPVVAAPVVAPAAAQSTVTPGIVTVDNVVERSRLIDQARTMGLKGNLDTWKLETLRRKVNEAQGVKPIMAAQTVATPTITSEVTGDKAALLNRIMGKMATLTMAELTTYAQLLNA